MRAFRSVRFNRASIRQGLACNTGSGNASRATLQAAMLRTQHRGRKCFAAPQAPMLRAQARRYSRSNASAVIGLAEDESMALQLL